MKNHVKIFKRGIQWEKGNSGMYIKKKSGISTEDINKTMDEFKVNIVTPLINSCRGCSTFENITLCFLWDRYSFSINKISNCPCTNCIIKVTCRKSCDKFKKHLYNIHPKIIIAKEQVHNIINDSKNIIYYNMALKYRRNLQNKRMIND